MNGIDPKNLTAQLAHRAVGNPPSTLPLSAISNAFPGLEMDFRNVWRRILVGITLHEASNLVLEVDADAPPEAHGLANDYVLMSVDGDPVTAPVTGPRVAGGPIERLSGIAVAPDDPSMPLEWSNALANVLPKAGKPVPCVFRQALDPTGAEITVMLVVRPFFAQWSDEDGTNTPLAVIAEDVAEPGQLTQSLCSPWQNDYRECGCFYWAASRPDYVNVEPRPDGTSTGNNWMEKDRTPETPRIYIVDDRMDERLVTYEDLFRHWEKSLRFIIGGRDAE